MLVLTKKKIEFNFQIPKYKSFSNVKYFSIILKIKAQKNCGFTYKNPKKPCMKIPKQQPDKKRENL